MEVPVDIIVDNGIERGVILHSTMFEYIDHGKFFVVIGVTQDYIAGYFFINSNIHKAVMSKPEQLNMQCILKRSDYKFLRYDSFLSAVRIEKVSCTRLAETLKNGETVIVAHMKK